MVNKLLINSKICEKLDDFDESSMYYVKSKSVELSVYKYSNIDIAFILNLGSDINIKSGLNVKNVKPYSLISLSNQSIYSFEFSKCEFVIIQMTKERVKFIANNDNQGKEINLFNKSDKILIFSLNYSVMKCVKDLFSEIENKIFLYNQLKKFKYFELILYLIRLIYKKKKSDNNDILIQINEYVNSNIFNKIDLDDLSNKLAVSKSCICHKFKKYHKKTIINYINDLRIEESCKLLKNDNLKVTTISKMVGFNSVNYFYKIFKKIKGSLPSEWRNRYKK